MKEQYQDWKENYIEEHRLRSDFKAKLIETYPILMDTRVYSPHNMAFDTRYFTADIYDIDKASDYDINKRCNTTVDDFDDMSEKELLNMLKDMQEEKKAFESALEDISTWFSIREKD